MPRMRMPVRHMGPRGMRPRGPRPVPPPGIRQMRAPGAPPMRPRLAPPPQPVPAPSITGNATNDPSTANKRVFVGNLNTIAISKEEVERIFSMYGIITGISMHKGYAFVQFAYEHEARVACGSEDNKTYAGQKLDCNIASEPKNKSTVNIGVKRPAVALQTVKMGGPGLSVGPPAMKKIRQDSIPTIKRTLVDLTGNAASIETKKTITPITANSALRKVATKDVLICGNCKTSFMSLHSLAQHKKVPCKLRFACKCQNAPVPDPESTDPTTLQCGTCNAEFSSSWALVQHCQEEHKMSIFKTEGQGQGDVATVEEVVEDIESILLSSYKTLVEREIQSCNYQGLCELHRDDGATDFEIDNGSEILDTNNNEGSDTVKIV
ncbi:Hypothetical predicted protein [Mytilus galloprovincialis]|nr:Hypothetical predicted protein [Mytilus galloprovincialis]